MADYFTMQRYHHQFIKACTRLRRAEARVEGMKERQLYTDDEDLQELQEQIAAAEEELRTAQQEAEELWYLSNTGKSKRENIEAQQYRALSPFGNSIGRSR